MMWIVSWTNVYKQKVRIVKTLQDFKTSHVLQNNRGFNELSEAIAFLQNVERFSNLVSYDHDGREFIPTKVLLEQVYCP